MNFSVINFGCKVNQYQGELLRENLILLGLIEATSPPYDLVFVNGCMVTETASREAMRTARKFSSIARVFLTGCLGKNNAKDGFEYINPDALEELSEKLGLQGNMKSEIDSFLGHTRAMVLVQLGCDNFCSYCIVPYMRGEPRNRPAKDIVEETKKLASSGFREIVLCGTELGHRKDLPDLIKSISGVRGIERIRLSSINPRHLSPSLVRELLSIEKVAPHLHLPLQSGSDRVLGLMNRGYNQKHFLQLVDAAREGRDEIGITTDILVGFPGENENDFEETIKVMEMAAFSRCHVFPFSKRPGTKAYDMEAVPDEIIKARAKDARAKASSLARQAISAMINRCTKVLVESDSEGFSGSYLRVRVTGKVGLGDFVPVRITGKEKEGLVGEKI
ncbi:MAG TPA: MiaB/RimO family radical SAM methylthiotransferase [Caldisericia bacterium]|nr:MiaB/RimO family radical SAM methylthiotransferase [Caldisericia bacterium]HOU07473.1 MiaB/RimO family radical SAM methylthiotransferase [Caldisericia bacterium]HQG59270.1 MiaB/RimO family radical SAM methylthiotransferase [Caldisericia bacterium]HQH48632.1 MiaB/RimO family radical SAM methylthiotransferase [Caldisericia bacterium]HQJ43995.1 MiaB/RimO family radical SAM methylthiotransferase [Caldisericia bacterium]